MKYSVVVLCAMIMAAAAAASPAMARDTFVGISAEEGRPWRRAGATAAAARLMDCCDNCQCEDPEGGSACTCYDRFESENGCPAGCDDCACDYEGDNVQSCSCNDTLDFCPDACGYDQYSAAATSAARPATNPAGGAGTGALLPAVQLLHASPLSYQ